MLDLNSIPHAGKPTSSTPHPGARLRVRVVIREELRGKMLPDGRIYGPGDHEIQIYKGDLPSLECLVEDRNDLLEGARRRHAAKVAAWVDSTRSKVTGLPGRNVDGNYVGGSVQTEFRNLTVGEPGSPKDGLGRGVRPLLSVEVLEELGSVKDEEHRYDVRMRAEEARAQISAQPAPVGLTQEQVEQIVKNAIMADREARRNK